MSNQYKIIDEKNWKRAMHCKVFRNSVEPAFCVTFELDITHFLEACLLYTSDALTMAVQMANVKFGK